MCLETFRLLLPLVEERRRFEAHTDWLNFKPDKMEWIIENWLPAHLIVPSTVPHILTGEEDTTWILTHSTFSILRYLSPSG